MDEPTPAPTPEKPTPETPTPEKPKFRFAWPLRVGAQIIPALWVWKLYGCMQLMDCSDPEPLERLIAHAILAALMAFGVEVVLLVNRNLDAME